MTTSLESTFPLEVATARSRFPIHVAVFLTPALLIYSVFSIYPLVDTIRLSLYASDQTGAQHFVGLVNFQTLLTDPAWSVHFWNALRNNLIFFAIHMVVQNGIGLGLAMLLSLPRLTGGNIYRTLIFLPTMLSVVIIGFVWQLILNPLWGIAPNLLKAVGLGSLFGPWLGQESTALITISLISVWQFVGIPMMLIYAALINIPDDLLDAATVDGAGPFSIFWFVRLPLILPTLGVVSILTFVANFNAFDLIYAVKGALAGPNFSTDILGTFFYRTFFGYQLQVGSPTMGATVATAMLIIILMGVLIYLFGVQRRLQRQMF
ncbi:carbohydrate ABC transporter permease [Microvirga puerhi]|uniref:Sugar ABC transporter permease n=1 Tax=Microvirga puerhi TaxID=2876078 RepID=A0ABS7VSI8_9HYPH|nr:sugar ABC transporter permease [Microvirga puerhi]MBZ6078521.1 sugar ABC transporter permease [Microvirga puerhi]